MFAAAAVLGCYAGCHAGTQVATLVIDGDTITMRKRAADAAQSSPSSTPVMILALDGVSRDLLYDLLRGGKLPHLAELVGGADLAHADLDDRLLSNLPSTTIPAWSAVFTGTPAGVNGVPNNEFFIRETKTFAAPAPVTFVDSAATMEVYTKGAVNKLVDAPSVYERIHTADPDALIWVALSHFFRGADKMFVAERTAFVKMFAAFVEDGLPREERKVTSRKPYEALDHGAIDAVVSHLASGPAPDVLTLYLSGTDLYAHVAKEGPDEARRAYLTEVIDPALAKLVEQMRARDMLANRWVIVTADHGHTAIIADAAHSIDTGNDDAPGVLHALGWKLRPFRASVGEHDPFNSVLAYGGAFGFVYLADRSRCTGERACAWDAPPRYREDVLALAEGFYRNNETGALAPGMRGTLDMIFVREPRPVGEGQRTFEVYVGGGKTMAIEAYLAQHPHPTYVDVARRIEELAVGRHGDRAGDILLLAHDGDRDAPEERYYFAAPFRSWHGSPSKQDSEVPLIVANPHVSAAAIEAWVGAKLGDRPYQRKVTDIVLGLRTNPPR
ncbi:MAG: alkaline phosphatase family protein [Deltaproteobacteria bacterium]